VVVGSGGAPRSEAQRKGPQLRLHCDHGLSHAAKQLLPDFISPRSQHLARGERGDSGELWERECWSEAGRFHIVAACMLMPLSARALSGAVAVPFLRVHTTLSLGLLRLSPPPPSSLLCPIPEPGPPPQPTCARLRGPRDSMLLGEAPRGEASKSLIIFRAPSECRPLQTGSRRPRTGACTRGKARGSGSSGAAAAAGPDGGASGPVSDSRRETEAGGAAAAKPGTRVVVGKTDSSSNGDNKPCRRKLEPPRKPYPPPSSPP